MALSGAAGLTRCSHAPTEEAAILDLSFDIVHRFRPFDLVAPGFVAVEEGRSRPVALRRTGIGPAAPFAAVEVTVDRADDAVVVAGLVTAAGEEVVAAYDAGRRRVTIEVRRQGRGHVVGRARAHLSAPFRFAFALCENQVTALVTADLDGGWRPLVTERGKVARLVDLRDPTALGHYAYGWGVRSGSGTAELAGVRAGVFGMTGLRDPHLVQHADGSPYLRDGKAYLTFTCAGLGFFQQAHWGVFTLDLDHPTRLVQVAQLFTERDGLVLGDHAGQLVRDDDRWLVGNSSWGDFSPGSVHVRHTTTTADLLSGVHLLATRRTPLPTAAGSWDPALTRVDGRWRVAFVESPSQEPFDFHPALAVASGAEWTQGLERVGAADDLHQCEGPILAKVAGNWWLLASDGDGRQYPVYDLGMRRAGRLDAPYPTNIPHPQLVPAPVGGWLLVTFDGNQYAERVMGYGGHGDVVIMRAR